MGWDEFIKKLLSDRNLSDKLIRNQHEAGIRRILREICLITELYKLADILPSFHCDRHINLNFKNSNCVQNVIDQQDMR